ncbi:MAG: carboxypeptidase regulatory-like domain-containing protein [Candidatus Kaiserbacteria bacterium]|nr:carboxypeptidase regulatory-like domain-containing protein [Candidatus Kaiserbacteria bacterium]
MQGERGVTLIDTIVGTALLLLVFVGVAAAFQLSVDVVTSNKARAGAIALVDERMEYIRSLPYTSLGTVGGIPSGSIPQNESVTLNGVTYNRRTFIEYFDDTKDGSGGGDANGVQADSKAAKVDVSWNSRTGVRHIIAVTRVSPATGLESAVSGGTLTIFVVDSTGASLSNAQITIVNATTSVNLTTYSNASGTATLIGTPAGAGYQITVTKSGYSTAQTYFASAQNTNPNPGNLTVSNSQTTSATFAIDVLGSKTVQSWSPVQSGTWTDPFADNSNVATSTNITIAGGVAKIAGSAPYGSGEVQSTSISPSYLSKWKQLSWTSSAPAGTSILYRVYDVNGGSLIPEAQLPGNAAGFTSSPIDLTSISTSTYQGLRIDATLSGSSSATPSIDAWNVNYDYGPTPLPNIALTMTGAKTIGTGPSGAVYKYSQTINTGASASVTVPNLEWDAYTLAVASSSSAYDIASACGPQPESLAPGAAMTTALYLLAHTANSLLVDVRASATGNLIPGASVTLSRTGFSSALTSDNCGQAFFSGLIASTYTIVVSAPGYVTYTGTNAVTVSGTTRYSVTLN